MCVWQCMILHLLCLIGCTVYCKCIFVCVNFNVYQRSVSALWDTRWCLLLCRCIANCMQSPQKSKLSRISVSRVPWVDNMFFHCVHSISPTVFWFLLLMKWIGWPLLQAHSEQCSNLSRCENALRLGGVTSTRLLTHNTSALLSRQPYPIAPMLL